MNTFPRSACINVIVCWDDTSLLLLHEEYTVPDSKVHGDNMGPTWVLPDPDGPHAGPMNLAIRGVMDRDRMLWLRKATHKGWNYILSGYLFLSKLPQKNLVPLPWGQNMGVLCDLNVWSILHLSGCVVWYLRGYNGSISIETYLRSCGIIIVTS